jgi:hypothetical protein
VLPLVVSSYSSPEIELPNAMLHTRIAKTIVGYLSSDSESHLYQKKDLLNIFFSCMDPQTQCMIPRQVAFGLKTNWYRQFIDGCYHYLNDPMVFDLGLHRGYKEPGCSESYRKAWDFAVNQMPIKVSISYYTSIHKIAVAHFKGDKVFTGTRMEGSKGGKFRHQIPTQTIALLKSLIPEKKEKERLVRNQKVIGGDGLVLIWQMIQEENGEELLSLQNYFKNIGCTEIEYPSRLAAARKMIDETLDRIGTLNSYIALRSASLGLDSPIASIVPEGVEGEEGVCMTYHLDDKDQIETVIDRLFAEYNEKMSHAVSSEEKIVLIADLFQVLEWIHPYPDGQGRTDLILLAEELCKHGLNPVILEEPFFSTFNLLADWVEYLKKGMEKWQRAFLHPALPISPYLSFVLKPSAL